MLYVNTYNYVLK